MILNKKTEHKLKRILVVTLGVAAICLMYGYYEARNIKIKEILLVSKDIPPNFVGKKVIFVSDTHANIFFSGNATATLVEKINALEPDIVLLGGDHTDGNPKHAKLYFEKIAQLKSNYGVYSVLGNHDHWWNASLTKKELKDANVKNCDNTSYWITISGDSIKIGGVGDFWEDTQILENTTNDLKETDFCILLSHNPDYMEVLDSDKIDLVLSGHTHAGQVTLFGLYAPITPSFWRGDEIQTGQKYLYGWNQKGNTKLYTSSGAGVGSIPIRFFAQPEIVQITLKRE